MTLTPADIKILVGALQESEWDQAEIVVGDVRVAVARNGASLDGGAAPEPSATAPQAVPVTAAPAPSPAPAEVPVAPSPAPVEEGGHVVTAPSVGVFWRAPEPGAQPYVEVGGKVEAGATIGIVEVMKLMSNVTTDVGGTVTAVHVDNAQSVEFGTPLVTIRPEG